MGCTASESAVLAAIVGHIALLSRGHSHNGAPRTQGWPRLIPIYAHRFTPAAPSPSESPVFSVWQTDIIYYGANLLEYLTNELLSGQGRKTLSPELSASRTGRGSSSQQTAQNQSDQHRRAKPSIECAVNPTRLPFCQIQH